MARVILDMSISVDGFIAGRDGTPDGRLHAWFFAPKGRSADVVQESIATTGAMVIGRRTYDLGDRMDGFVDNPYRVPHVVLSHSAPSRPAQGDTAFVFVRSGVVDALEQARAAAGTRTVVVGGGAECARQALESGLVEELHLHIVPVLLGAGIPLFGASGAAAGRQLEQRRVVQAPDALHCVFGLVP